MQETMPLGRTYKYNSRNRLSNGYSYVKEKTPSGRTYMNNSRNHL